MSRHDLDPTTRAALGALDPAPARPATAADAERSDALLRRVLSARTALPAAEPSGPRHRTRRTARRVAVLGGLAAATTVGVVGVQLMTGGDTAYATWTATPQRPTTPQEVRAAGECRESLSESVSGAPLPDGSGATPERIARARVVLSEQRGDWTLVVLGDDGGLEGSCITQDGPLLGGAGFGSVGVSSPAARGSHDVLVTSSGSGGSSDSTVSVLFGLVGSDVTEVTVHTADHGDVEATVDNGHLAAWWPGPKDTDHAVLDAASPATVTYADGTTWTGVLGVGSDTQS